MKKVIFIKNIAVLTGTALILRFVGIFFRVWVAGAIGAEGMGLYQVIYSVYVFAATFATSGICTAVTRMVTARLSLGDKKGVGKILRVSVILSLFIALLSAALIVLFAEPISKYFIGDVGAALSLKILTLGLPFLGVCSVIRGYFLARRSTLPTALGQLMEQAARIAIIVFLITKYADKGSTATTAAVILGDTLAEIIGTVFIYIAYKIDFIKLKNKCKEKLSKRKVGKEIIRISLPLSSGRYLHTGLRTVENLITPGCFSKYSGSRSDALSQFGMIKAMALPLLLFPASLLSAISTLLVPEVTDATEKGDKGAVRYAVGRTFYLTSVISFFIAGVFFIAAKVIGKLVYNSLSVGYLIKALAPLVPFMYIDLIADGILKGLDQQKTLFKNNVSDSVIRIILVLILVPRFGMIGFLGVMIFSNVYTATLSVVRIVKTTGLKFNLSFYFFKPLTAIFLSAATVDVLCRPIKNNPILYLILSVIGVFALYVVLLIFFGVFDLQKTPFKKRKNKKKV